MCQRMSLGGVRAVDNAVQQRTFMVATTVVKGVTLVQWSVLVVGAGVKRTVIFVIMGQSLFEEG